MSIFTLPVFVVTYLSLECRVFLRFMLAVIKLLVHFGYSYF